jgi:leucyl-tRNA synthetase
MRDEGLTDVSEPFTNLLTQGMVLKDGAKMSKNKGNVVDPQELIVKYGADTVRLFMMFAAPPEQSLEWSDEGVQGSYRFLKRFWHAVVDDTEAGAVVPLDVAALDEGQKALRRKTHQTIAKIDDDIGRRRSFNTGVAAAMELLNAVNRFEDSSEQGRAVVHEALEAVVLMLSPMTPHICHALWKELGHKTPLIDQQWPAFDEAALELDTIELVVQVNGKLRGRVAVPADADRETIEKLAIADENVQRFVDGKAIRKVIVVPGRLVNIVV